MTDHPTLQSTILVNILKDETYARKVLPHLKAEYFDQSHRVLFTVLDAFVSKYNVIPDSSAFQVELQSSPLLRDEITDSVSSILVGFNDYVKPNEKWLLDTTESWCKERAMFNAVMEAFSVVSGKSEKLTPEAIPDMMRSALNISFDTRIGHDYFMQAEERFEYYHLKEHKLEFDLEMFNRVTKGGFSKKTLNAFMSGPGVGKSMFMCHMAATNLLQSKNVLYITMEMAEERISERIDENLLDLDVDALHGLAKDLFMSKIDKLKTKTSGKLIVKEYPTGSAHAGHFRALLNDLRAKKSFKPDIIYVDYLNICASSRMKKGGTSSYEYVKAIAEELRGLAVEFDLPIVTATQVNREGYGDSDVDMANTSESWGLPATLDSFFALCSTEQLEQLNQILVIQLKNRYHDVNTPKKFMIGIDRAKMKLHDVDSRSNSSAKDIPVESAKPFSIANKRLSQFRT